MDAFTILTGLASLFGFAFQIFDVFPQHARGRQSIWMLIMGGFIGGLLATLDVHAVRLDFAFTGYTISMTALAVLVVFFAVMAAFTESKTRRRGFYIVGGLAALAFAITTSVAALIGTVSDSDLLRQDTVNAQELQWLAERAQQRGDTARQAHHLALLLDRLDADDERRGALQAELDRLRRQP